MCNFGFYKRAKIAICFVHKIYCDIFTVFTTCTKHYVRVTLLFYLLKVKHTFRSHVKYEVNNA